MNEYKSLKLIEWWQSESTSVVKFQPQYLFYGNRINISGFQVKKNKSKNNKESKSVTS